ncbi:MAG: hypothetical protein HUJ26_04825 [Planctomycetaceae bacterium]|nr:hypothetical protein [Planctomycetaceae bacterium]
MPQRVSKILLSESQRDALFDRGQLTLHQTIIASTMSEFCLPLSSQRQADHCAEISRYSSPRRWKPVYRRGQFLAVMEEFVLDEVHQVLVFNDGESRQIFNEEWMKGFASRDMRQFPPIFLPYWGVRTWLEVISCVPELVNENWNWKTVVEQVPSPVKAIPRSRQKFRAGEPL